MKSVIAAATVVLALADFAASRPSRFPNLPENLENFSIPPPKASSRSEEATIAVEANNDNAVRGRWEGKKSGDFQFFFNEHGIAVHHFKKTTHMDQIKLEGLNTNELCIVTDKKYKDDDVVTHDQYEVVLDEVIGKAMSKSLMVKIEPLLKSDIKDNLVILVDFVNRESSDQTLVLGSEHNEYPKQEVGHKVRTIICGWYTYPSKDRLQDLAKKYNKDYQPYSINPLGAWRNYDYERKHNKEEAAVEEGREVTQRKGDKKPAKQTEEQLTTSDYE